MTSTPATAADTDRLAVLIGRKLGLLEQIRELARRQAEAVRREVAGGGELGKLMNVLAAKEHLLADLQSLQRDLAPFRNQDPETRQWRSPEARQQCRTAVERCELLLGEILVVERQCETDMTARRDQAAERLAQVQGAGAAAAAYCQPPAPRPTGQLDLSSD